MMGDDVELLLWLEDDVVLMENFFPSLTSILSHHRARLDRAPWLDIKLYLIPGLRGESGFVSSSLSRYSLIFSVTGYAWDPQPLLELMSSTGLITLILHQTFNRIFTVDRRRTWLARLTVLFILVLLTLQSISRYDLCPLCSPSSCNISLQTTHSPVEENPPSAIRLEASSRSGDCSHSLQQDKPREDCFPSENISSQWTSRPSDLKIQERDWLGWVPLGAQLGETYRQSVQQISSTDWRYQGVPGQLQHLSESQ